jgi:hypothetical protein
MMTNGDFINDYTGGFINYHTEGFINYDTLDLLFFYEIMLYQRLFPDILTLTFEIQLNLDKPTPTNQSYVTN